MILPIRLIGTTGRLQVTEPFLLSDNEELTLQFECYYKYAQFRITLKNGELEKVYHQEGAEFTVPDEFMTPGDLAATVELMKGHTVHHAFEIEPITLVNRPTGFAGMAAFEDLKNRVSALENTLKDLKETIVKEILKDENEN